MSVVQWLIEWCGVFLAHSFKGAVCLAHWWSRPARVKAGGAAAVWVLLGGKCSMVL